MQSAVCKNAVFVTNYLENSKILRIFAPDLEPKTLLIMRNRILLTALFAVILFSANSVAQPNHDWAGFNKYATDNNALREHHIDVKVVFYGNSIMQIWNEIHPEFFTQYGFIDRGIGGQTSSELLVRMRQDVIDLNPQMVIIECGANDIAQNNGYISLDRIIGNIISMCELAKANHIQPILCSPLPASAFYWHPTITNAAPKLAELRERVKAYAHKQQIVFIDFYSLFADEQGGMKEETSEDGVHPNLTGYLLMEPLVLNALGIE